MGTQVVFNREAAQAAGMVYTVTPSTEKVWSDEVGGEIDVDYIDATVRIPGMACIDMTPYSRNCCCPFNVWGDTRAPLQEWLEHNGIQYWLV